MAGKRAGGTSKPGASSSGGGGGFGGAVKSVGSRGASYITASQGRQTAFLLIVAIFVARLALTNQLQTFWAAMWGQSRPLGTALPSKVAAAGAAQTQGTAASTQTPQTVTTSKAPAVATGAGAIFQNIFGNH